MKEITKAELLESILNELVENDVKYGSDVKHISINGITLYYTSYNCYDKVLDDGEFWIDFNRDTKSVCTFRSYKTNYIYFDYTMYEII